MSDQSGHFGLMLAGAMAELEQAEGTLVPPDDPIDRLRLAAQQTLLAQEGGSLPRAGAGVYLEDTHSTEPQEGHKLDVRY